MATANIYDLADTWNDGATTFTAIKMNVTDTASASGSMLMGLQVGGVSKFAVGSDGTVGLTTSSQVNFGNSFTFKPAGLRKFSFGQTSTQLWVGLGEVIAAPLNGYFGIGGYGSGIGNQPTARVRLYDEADHVLGQRNGANAQTINIYNAFTNTTNYERARMGWAGNVFEIKPQAEGSGTVRTLHISGLPTTDPAIAGVLWNDAGTVKASAG